MTNRDIMHIGNRSWWDGSVTTLCGLKIARAERVWLPSLSGKPTCTACKSAHKAR